MMNFSLTRPALHLPRAASLADLGEIVQRAMALRHQRRALGRLDDAQLADLGLSRAEAAREAARPFWDFPAA